MKRLIVNADDLGLTPGVNRAIVEAHRDGLVTSTSLIANGAAFDDAINLLAENPGLAVGLHVNLVYGKPVAEAVDSLVNQDGEFHSLADQSLRLTMGAARSDELRRELAAQAERLRASGVVITHIDSHRNIHLHPLAGWAISRLADEIGVRWVRFRRQRPILPRVGAQRIGIGDRLNHAAGLTGFLLASVARAEWPRVDRFIAGVPALPDASPAAHFDAMLEALPDGITEWACHPGYVDSELRALAAPKYTDRRDGERQLLIDPEALCKLSESQIELISYRDI
jgi:predicted glycoside hydrolase/deacetylase ChbG (UPF0249 family)